MQDSTNPNRNKEFLKCPKCKVEGTIIEGNSVVRTHKFLNDKGAPKTHTWSVKSGRLLTEKVSDDDELW